MTKVDEIEKVAQAMAETTNGGDFNDGRWYSDEHRALWRKRAEVAHKVMTIEFDASVMDENRELAERILQMNFERIDMVSFADEVAEAADNLSRTLRTTCHELRKAKRKAAIEPETHDWLVKRLERAHKRFARVRDGWE